MNRRERLGRHNWRTVERFWKRVVKGVFRTYLIARFHWARAIIYMSVQQRFLYAILLAHAMGLQQAEETEEVGRRMRGAGGLERERER